MHPEAEGDAGQVTGGGEGGRRECRDRHERRTQCRRLCEGRSGNRIREGPPNLPVLLASLKKQTNKNRLR